MNAETSDFFKIESGAPQGSVLGPLLYVLFTIYIPTPPNFTIAAFVDDTVVLFRNNNLLLASQPTQNYISILEKWLNKWHIIQE